jgi:hypothetical protein
MIEKKIAHSLLIVFVLLLVSCGSAYSQSPGETEFDKAYTQYSQKLEDYNKKHDAYVLARSNYLKFETLQSKTDAQGATLDLLQARDDVLLLYLNSLKVKLDEVVTPESSRASDLQLKIDEEVNWLNDHKSRLSSAGTLEDLVSDSDEEKARYQQVTQSLFYEILSNISYEKESSFQNREGDLLSFLKDRFNQIKGEQKFGTTKLQTIDRWIFESEGRFQRSDEKQLEADKIITTAVEKKSNFASTYEGVVSTLGQAQQYLKEASSFMKEVIREIKTAE